MKKTILLVTVSILGLYTLKAQEPDVIFSAERAFEFRLPESRLWIQCELQEPMLSCTRHSTTHWFSTTNDAFVFNKPVYTSQIGTLCGEDFHLYVSGKEALKINQNGNIYSTNLTIGHYPDHDWSYGMYISVNRDMTKAFAVNHSNSGDIFCIMGNGVTMLKKLNAESIEVRPDAMNYFWYDHVFSPDYKLRPLKELDIYVKEKHHLPDIPSEEEVKENGMNVFEMNALLLKKIEELTLYMIELQKQIDELKVEKQKGGE
ncbi:MAG: hypothetical protein LBS55_05120 [Prevotellaceae bacterium]|jgi:hypothetical protein|nr:hypothetical protein [Prevotellaceae bacterium]